MHEGGAHKSRLHISHLWFSRIGPNPDETLKANTLDPANNEYKDTEVSSLQPNLLIFLSMILLQIYSL